MRKRNLLIIAAVMSAMTVNGISVCAAPERMPDGTIFDAAYYAETNPDVAAEAGSNPEILYQHYMLFGKAEGRSATNPADAEQVAKMKETRQITISFAGDCTLGGFKGQGGGNLLRDYYEQYGNDYFFKNVKEIFEQDDLTYVNLEGALTQYGQVVEKKFPIKGEPEYVGALQSGSIEVVNLANNHTYDCGQAGYDSCRQLLADNGIAYCGEAETCTLDRNGIKTGFIGLNCWGMNSALEKKLQGLITRLRNDQKCDIICVMFHGGIEREYESNAVTETFAHRAIDYGADIVVGAHPHVVQGIEVYQGKVICYSLGNFSFGANKNPSDKDTFIFQQTFFVDSTGAVSYGQSKIIPCKVSSTDVKNDYCPTPQTGAEYDRIMQKLARCSRKYPVSYFDLETVPKF